MFSSDEKSLRLVPDERCAGKWCHQARTEQGSEITSVWGHRVCYACAGEWLARAEERPNSEGEALAAEMFAAVSAKRGAA